MKELMKSTTTMYTIAITFIHILDLILPFFLRTNDIIMPFKIGAVKMAHETDTQIVPFTITGKYKAFKKDITIEFYKPIKLKSNDLTKENERLMTFISKQLEEKRK